jgi:hypothetical protein
MPHLLDARCAKTIIGHQDSSCLWWNDGTTRAKDGRAPRLSSRLLKIQPQLSKLGRLLRVNSRL